MRLAACFIHYTRDSGWLDLAEGRSPKQGFEIDSIDAFSWGADAIEANQSSVFQSCKP